MLLDAGAWDARRVVTTVIGGAWIAFGLYWIAAARTKNPAQKREPVVERLLHVLWLAFGFFLFYTDDPRLGPLNLRFVPERLWVVSLGAAATVAGVALAIWARWHLGKNWSAEVTIRKEHALIRSGPYARIRHPIYTGLLLALAGTALTIGEYRGLVALGIFLIGWMRKATKEERFLTQEFGAAFEEHKKVTGFFLPRLF